MIVPSWRYLMNFSLREIRFEQNMCQKRARQSRDREGATGPLLLGRGYEKNGVAYFGRFQRRTVLSRLPERARRPSGEKATLVTEAERPGRRQTSRVLATSQS